MKKLILLPLIALFFLTLTGCKKAEDPLKLISAEQIEEKFANNETFLLLLGSKTCQGCQEFKEDTMEQYIKQGNAMKVYFVDEIESFDTEDDFNQFKTDHGIDYTTSPTTYFVKEGVIVGSLVDNQSLDDLNAFVEEHQ